MLILFHLLWYDLFLRVCGKMMYLSITCNTLYSIFPNMLQIDCDFVIQWRVAVKTVYQLFLVETCTAFSQTFQTNASIQWLCVSWKRNDMFGLIYRPTDYCHCFLFGTNLKQMFMLCYSTAMKTKRVHLLFYETAFTTFCI